MPSIISGFNSIALDQRFAFLLGDPFGKKEQLEDRGCLGWGRDISCEDIGFGCNNVRAAYGREIGTVILELWAETKLPVKHRH